MPSQGDNEFGEGNSSLIFNEIWTHSLKKIRRDGDIGNGRDLEAHMFCHKIFRIELTAIDFGLNRTKNLILK